MTFLRKAELLHLNLWGFCSGERIISLDQLTLERVLERCRSKGLSPLLGAILKPDGSGCVWRCMIGRVDKPDDRLTSGTSDDSAWDAVAEAVLRYYGAWEETE